jgi:beta-lactamase regulating signal transducer with metallopeptidase domain
MRLLLTSAADVSMVLALGLAAAALLRRRCAAWRHWVLATTILCAAAVPALEIAVPAWDLPLPAWTSPGVHAPIVLTSRRIPVAAGTRATSQSAAAGGLITRVAANRDAAVVAVWLVGAAVGLGILLAGLWRLARLGRGARVVCEESWIRLAAEAARRHGVRRPVLLLHSRHPTLVVTWGVRRPRVLLPEAAHEWSEDRMRVVLLHELAHVRRGDWGFLIAASMLRCLYWFNPLAWMTERRLRHESEQACDDAVLEAGIDGADYAAHLLAVANDAVRLRHLWTPAAAVARPSTLEERIRAMLNARLNRDPLTRWARALTMLALVAATMSIAAAAPAPGGNGTGRDVALTSAAVDVTSTAPRAQRAPAIAAQAGPGVVAGTLYDQMGGLLPGAEVSMVHSATRANYAMPTDETGSFEFRNLPTGQYTIDTSLPGFERVRAVVEVTQGNAIYRSLTLPLGSIEETITVTSGNPAAERPRASRAPSGRSAVSAFPRPRAAAAFTGGIGGQISVPSKIGNVNPVYPASLQGIEEGHVVLAGRIGIDGYIVDLRQVENAAAVAPHPAFVDAAMDAVQQWAFSPTLLNGVPVEVNISVNVRFSLQ